MATHALIERASDARHDDAALAGAIAAACDRIAPLWPLKHFVAVNPFLGFSHCSFAETAATLRRVADIDMLMPAAFYEAALANGTMTEDDLAAAIAATPPSRHRPADTSALVAALRRPAGARTRPAARVATVAEVLDRLASGDRQASRTAFMIDEISRFCAGWFDNGQASWPQPGGDAGPYAGWRALALHDRNPEAMGVRGFRATVAALPIDPVAAIGAVVAALGIPPRALTDYLHRALLDIGGWAAYARYKVWDNALYGRADTVLVELLAIRVVWGFGLFRERSDPAFRAAWAVAMAEAAAAPADDRLGDDPALWVQLVAHQAYELAYQRRLLGRIGRHLMVPWTAHQRPAVQAAFCIDVRSEVFRRALEAETPQAQTIGFAGFFGFSIEYVPIGRTHGGAQCPVLLTPGVTVVEEVRGKGPAEQARVLDRRLLRRRAGKAWKAFRHAAVSSFTFVETMGLGYAPKLAADSMGATRPAPDPRLDGLDADDAARLGPRLDPLEVGGRATGFPADKRLDMAETVLRAMSLTEGFAPLVLLAGHGSTTVNNPHASGLDCGACGGHTGEANARVAAAILNDPDVRRGLVERGIFVPETTWFLAGLHDTTTDAVTLYDLGDASPSQAANIDQLQRWLAGAGRRARAERACTLALDDGATDTQVLARSRDWSQVRPEWGLAGNAAFIAAPRARTAGLDLGGRAFLHSYDWQADKGFGILELIMTAPMVVASWINLQYYGSVVNNRAFGSGNKVLHNVTGVLGVLEGNGGDLRTGLPWQSVHDGNRLIHEPLRLNAIIEAPTDAIDAVLAKHKGVRDLVDNGWVHLFALVGARPRLHRYRQGGGWEAVEVV